MFIILGIFAKLSILAVVSGLVIDSFLLSIILSSSASTSVSIALSLFVIAGSLSLSDCLFSIKLQSSGKPKFFL